jgi:tRNA threonylcarbamoyladenosine biosynthesis protein TsaB
VNILALDTATAQATIAVSVGDRIAAETAFNADRALSARLIPEIGHLLSLAGITMGEIDLFGAAVGPGSFTGVRGGIATIQGLALANNKPCAGFSSLALLAMNFSLDPTPVCPLLDARKSEVYGALYDCTTPVPTPLIADCVLSPERFLQQLSEKIATPVIFCGDGTLRYRDLIAGKLGDRALFAPETLTWSRAANGTVLARHAADQGTLVKPAYLLPTYLRASDAEINRAK